MKPKKYTSIWNDTEALTACLDDENIYITFNGKRYDQFIMKAVAAGFSPEEVKQVNDYIIAQGKKGWTYPPLKDFYFRPNIVDVPCLERLYLATPQKDYAIVAQSIGRIARVCEGKKDAIAYDFVDDIGYTARAWKKRCTTYRKIDCYFVEEDS